MALCEGPSRSLVENHAIAVESWKERIRQKGPARRAFSQKMDLSTQRGTKEIQFMPELLKF